LLSTVAVQQVVLHTPDEHSLEALHTAPFLCGAVHPPPDSTPLEHAMQSPALEHAMQPPVVEQLVHTVAPAALKVPGGHAAAAGVDVVDPAGHAYPALQFEQTGSPDRLKVPAGHIAVAGVDEVDAAGHA
jgi:hypothetical protein